IGGVRLRSRGITPPTSSYRGTAPTRSSVQRLAGPPPASDLVTPSDRETKIGNVQQIALLIERWQRRELVGFPGRCHRLVKARQSTTSSTMSGYAAPHLPPTTVTTAHSRCGHLFAEMRKYFFAA